MDQEREDILKQYESAVRAFNEAIEHARGLKGLEFYTAMIKADRLYDLALRLEEALARFDQAMR